MRRINQRTYVRFLAWKRALTKSATTALIPLVIGVLIFLIYSQPSQMIDLHALLSIAVIDGIVAQKIGPLFFLIFTLTILTFGLAGSAVYRLHRDDLMASKNAVRIGASYFIIALAFLLPTMGVLYGLGKAHVDTDLLRLPSWMASGFGRLVVVILTIVLISAFVSIALARSRLHKLILDNYSHGRAALIGACVIFICLCAIFPIDAPRLIGTHAIVGFFCLTLLIILTNINNLPPPYKKPLITITVLSFLLANGFGWNDNHQARMLERPQNEWSYRDLDASDNFPVWLLSRKDLSYYEPTKTKYPVFVISAEGGGLYAGYNAALFLARMQDNCPSFSQHVFAISSVSGGSLGAAVFSGLALGSVKQTSASDCKWPFSESGPIEKAVVKFFAADFLSPLAFGFFFPDALQRVLPFPVPWFDRARYLESSFEKTWQDQKIANSDFITRGIYEQWTPTQVAPAVLMNTTEVSTGGQVVIGPWAQLSLVGVQSIGHFTGIEYDFPMSTAVSLSARFPMVTPPGTVPLLDIHKVDGVDEIRLVDGGYFENSGSETARALVKELQRLKSMSVEELTVEFASAAYIELKERTLRSEQADSVVRAKSEALAKRFKSIDFAVHAITIGAINYDPGYPNSATFSDFISPFTTLMNTRRERGHRSLLEFSDAICASCRFSDTKFFDEPVHPVLLNASGFDLPLGWVMSDRSRDYIANGLSVAGNCDLSSSRGAFDASVKNDNVCTYQFVRSVLEACRKLGSQC